MSIGGNGYLCHAPRDARSFNSTSCVYITALQFRHVMLSLRKDIQTSLNSIFDIQEPENRTLLYAVEERYSKSL